MTADTSNGNLFITGCYSKVMEQETVKPHEVAKLCAQTRGQAGMLSTDLCFSAESVLLTQHNELCMIHEGMHYCKMAASQLHAQHRQSHSEQASAHFTQHHSFRRYVQQLSAAAHTALQAAP